MMVPWRSISRSPQVAIRRPYALIVAISTSNTFLLPSANPVLLVVAGPGGYRTRDFLRVGLPLTVLILATTLIMVNLVFDQG